MTSIGHLGSGPHPKITTSNNTSDSSHAELQISHGIVQAVKQYGLQIVSCILNTKYQLLMKRELINIQEARYPHCIIHFKTFITVVGNNETPYFKYHLIKTFSCYPVTCISVSMRKSRDRGILLIPQQLNLIISLEIDYAGKVSFLDISKV